MGPAIGAVTTLLAGVALLLARRKAAVPTVAGERLPFRRVFRAMTPLRPVPGAGLGRLRHHHRLVTLLFASHGWDHAALALTLLGACFVLARLLLADAIGRFGGYPVALASFAVEACGLALIALAATPAMALAGAAVTGFGFALVFPALGMEAVRPVPQSNRGSALGAMRFSSTRRSG